MAGTGVGREIERDAAAQRAVRTARAHGRASLRPFASSEFISLLLNIRPNFNHSKKKKSRFCRVKA